MPKLQAAILEQSSQGVMAKLILVFKVNYKQFRRSEWALGFVIHYA